MIIIYLYFLGGTLNMKKAKGDNPINTIPKGVYEGGVINKEIRKNKNNELNDISTDTQGNGYPTNRHKEK